MELAGYVVNAVVLEGRPVREVAGPTGCPRPGSTSYWLGTKNWASKGWCPALNVPGLPRAG